MSIQPKQVQVPPTTATTIPTDLESKASSTQQGPTSSTVPAGPTDTAVIGGPTDSTELKEKPTSPGDIKVRRVEIKDKPRPYARLVKTLSSLPGVEDAGCYVEKLRDIKTEFEQNEDKQALIKLFETLGHKERFLILDCLKDGSRCVSEIVGITGRCQSCISYHLKVLETQKLVKPVKTGRYNQYVLVKVQFDRLMELWQTWLGGATNWL
eukprot:gnl/Dysnectes_brevis/1333_a1497_2471.p1 GENE.gnl/Dysnectes_brevis/1333_a1497_2471~~gnl/Dysnectes_brevis/1333_a1497_2471.p1  ORF type:complete len:229 (+),score=36.00 gnl/Dysnectes_brevis/1333_a1497_2471:60-689(+)